MGRRYRPRVAVQGETTSAKPPVDRDIAAGQSAALNRFAGSRGGDLTASGVLGSSYRRAAVIGQIAVLDRNLVRDEFRIVPDAPDEGRSAPGLPWQADEIEAGLS